MQSLDTRPRLFARLKQHHIYRAAVGYGAAVAVLIQVVARAFPYFGWAAAVPAAIIVLLASFPVVLLLTWLVVEPEGVTERLAWSKRHWTLAAAVTPLVMAAIVVSGVFAFRFGERHAAHVAATQAAALALSARSVAVLPFENLSSDQNNEYFVAGMQDLILTKLTDIGSLKVIARTSTAKYASHPDDVKTIGRQLDVATVLEGSVQKQGNQVLINVRLIAVETEAQLWAQTYQRTLDNIFGVQGEVAGQVADALDAKLSPAQTAQLAAVPTTNQTAYDLFLRAEYQANLGATNYSTSSWKAAIPLYRQAVAYDPKFALAYARLSHAESALAWFAGGGEDVKQLNTQARRDAEQALKLAPELPAAHLALGYSDYYGRGDYPRALKHFMAALALKPNDPDSLLAQGYMQRRLGRFDDAIASMQQASALDPRNSVLVSELGLSYALVWRYTDAESAYRRALAVDPDNLNARTSLSETILFGTGDIPRALAVVQGDEPDLKLERVELLTDQRNYQAALALLDSVPDAPDVFEGGYGGSKALAQAQLYWLLGNVARARPLYQRALPIARAQLKRQYGINRAFVWSNVATAQLGLGQTAQALKSIAASQAIADRSGDQMYAPWLTYQNALLYAEARRPDRAIPLLVRALASPGIGAYNSPVDLWLAPGWDPIRHDPRFQALLQTYVQYKPAVVPTVPAARSSTPQPLPN